MERNKTRRRGDNQSRVSKKTISAEKIEAFQKKVFAFYRAHKRDLPWRLPALSLREGTEILDPYKILVAEVMLQQTQVHRVIPKYQAFLARFPTVQSLARGTSREVLMLWSGLGYNSRGLRLKKAAEVVVANHNNEVPQAKESLVALPGVGPYTAGAVRVFAYNKPDVFLETNIRTVLVHEFFSHSKKKVSDKEMLHIVTLVLPKKNFRVWYSALMDYGATLKAKGKSQNAKVRGYKKQSAFQGSNREVRGAIMKLLIQKKKLTGVESQLLKIFSKARLSHAFDTLQKDNILVRRGRYYLLQD